LPVAVTPLPSLSTSLLTVCKLCNVKVQPSTVEWAKHNEGKKHLKNVERFPYTDANGYATSTPYISTSSSRIPTSLTPSSVIPWSFSPYDFRFSPSETVKAAPTVLSSVLLLPNSLNTTQANGSASILSRTFLNAKLSFVAHYHDLFDFRKNWLLILRDEKKDEARLPLPLPLPMPVACVPVPVVVANAESFRLPHVPTVYDAPWPSQSSVSQWFCLPCMFDCQNKNRMKKHFDTDAHKAKHAEYNAWKVQKAKEAWHARMSRRFAHALDDDWQSSSEDDDVDDYDDVYDVDVNAHEYDGVDADAFADLDDGFHDEW
jgi:hypothetical protein